jgi:hypothetical protein
MAFMTYAQDRNVDPLSARDQEERLLTRCTAIANGKGRILDQREANVCRIAAMILGRTLERQALNLAQASDDYFRTHPAQQLEPGEVIRRHWIIGLPRLRDRLTRKIAGRS